MQNEPEDQEMTAVEESSQKMEAAAEVVPTGAQAIPAANGPAPAQNKMNGNAMVEGQASQAAKEVQGAPAENVAGADQAE